MTIKEWRVFNHSRNVGELGTVTETTEELARVAALAKYAIFEDDDNLEMGGEGPIGILPTDDFDVREI